MFHNKKQSKKQIQYEDDSSDSTALPYEQVLKNANNSKKEKLIREIPIDTSKASKQTKITINNITIYFPHIPYDNQVQYMSKVIEACENGKLAGLESPTGTGKTLCLLCAVLAWLKHKRKQLIDKRKKNNNILEDDFDLQLPNEEMVPKIYYSSRTHSQLSNAIKELKKTCYMPRTCILSSREKMCVNAVVKNFKGNALNLKCKQVRYRKECKYFFGAERLLMSNYDNCDIEELYQCGTQSKFCPFYFERNKNDYADITFLPYNYIFDPSIKKRLKLKLKNSILIVDEAHNVESVCEDAVSCEFSVKTIDEVLNDLKAVRLLIQNNNHVLTKDSVLATVTAEDIQDEETILISIKSYLKSLTIKTGKFWPDIGLKLTPKEMFDIFFEGSRTKSKGQTLLINPSKDEKVPCITQKNLIDHINLLNKIESGISDELQKGSLIIEYLTILNLIHLLSENYLDFISSNDNNPLNNYCNNYKFFINDVEETFGFAGNNNKFKFNNNNQKQKNRTLFLYCFNPGFGFKEILKENVSSIIITSGTLSPLEGVESELKCSFDIKLENTHVIQNTQVNFALLANSTRKNRVMFRFDNQNRQNVEMLNELGYTITDLCKDTPGGVLVFFPSYSFLSHVVSIWGNSGIWSNISEYKEIYQDMHDNQKNKSILKCYQNANKDKNNKGAILFSVCRGTTSEGIDFSDDYARMVIVVGIPYPNLGDVKVQLKKEYLDEFNRKNIQYITDAKILKLSGNDWYSQCASRCVNQAIGRVIRHVGDYGAMVLIDSRFKEFINRRLISKWLRDNVKSYFDNRILSELNKFYALMKNFKPPKRENPKIKHLQNYEKEFNNISFDNHQHKMATGIINSDKHFHISNDVDIKTTSKRTSFENDYSNKYLNSNIRHQRDSIGFINKAGYEQERNDNKDEAGKQTKIGQKRQRKSSSKKKNDIVNNKLITTFLTNSQQHEDNNRTTNNNNERTNVVTNTNINTNKPSDNVVTSEFNLDDLSQEELMEFLNDNIDLFDDVDDNAQNQNQNKQQEPNAHNVVDGNRNVNINNTNSKRIQMNNNNNVMIPSTSKKRVVKSNSKYIPSSKSKSKVGKSLNYITPLKPKESIDDIKSDAIIKKLLELKEKSQLDALFEKYNLKLEFEKEAPNDITLNNNQQQGKRMECPICFENNKSNEMIEFASAKCGHILCQKCWDQCLKQKLECPICKKRVRANTLIHLYI